uniref:Cyclic nucleotide-binding domain-containing protein n=1 Tax=Macrostomum lignano TaxID=282301 RepID=A0A1I8JRC4_9PLAT
MDLLGTPDLSDLTSGLHSPPRRYIFATGRSVGPEVGHHNLVDVAKQSSGLQRHRRCRIPILTKPGCAITLACAPAARGPPHPAYQHQRHACLQHQPHLTAAAPSRACGLTPMSDNEELAITDVHAARLKLADLVMRINQLDPRNRTMPLLLNRQAVNFRGISQNLSVAQTAEMPPSPHRWRQHASSGHRAAPPPQSRPLPAASAAACARSSASPTAQDDEIWPFIRHYDFRLVQEPSDLLFDLSQYRVNRQARFPTEVAQILRKEPVDPDGLPSCSQPRCTCGATRPSLIYPIRMAGPVARPPSTDSHHHPRPNRAPLYDKKATRPRRIIIRQGHKALSFYFILSGTCMVMLMDREQGLRQTRCYLSQGQSFGELAIIERTIPTGHILSVVKRFPLTKPTVFGRGRTERGGTKSQDCRGDGSRAAGLGRGRNSGSCGTGGPGFKEYIRTIKDDFDAAYKLKRQPTDAWPRSQLVRVQTLLKGHAFGLTQLLHGPQTRVQSGEQRSRDDFQRMLQTAVNWRQYRLDTLKAHQGCSAGGEDFQALTKSRRFTLHSFMLAAVGSEVFIRLVALNRHTNTGFGSLAAALRE